MIFRYLGKKITLSFTAENKKALICSLDTIHIYLNEDTLLRVALKFRTLLFV